MPPTSKFFEMNMHCDPIWCNFEIMLQWYSILFFSRDHVLTMLHLAPTFANVNNIKCKEDPRSY